MRNTDPNLNIGTGRGRCNREAEITERMRLKLEVSPGLEFEKFTTEGMMGNSVGRKMPV